MLNLEESVVSSNHDDTYIRKPILPTEKPMLCSDVHGTLPMPALGKVVTVNDAIALLSRVKDKTVPLLVDSQNFVRSLSWEEDEFSLRLFVDKITSGPLEWAQPDPDTISQSPSKRKLVYINVHDGVTVTTEFPSLRGLPDTSAE